MARRRTTPTGSRCCRLWLGNPGDQVQHDYLYWELGRQQAVRAGDWKLVRLTGQAGRTQTLLFNLADDIGELDNLAEAEPLVLERMLTIARVGRHRSEEFPSVYDHGR